jgi:prepilin-type N-terminal cleavage/methylation domain-containing protein
MLQTPPYPSKRATIGFTLIELLVVISIIALLVAILLPALSAARLAAQRMMGASNMRSAGLAIELFSQDNDGYLPSGPDPIQGTAARGLYFHFRPYANSDSYTLQWHIRDYVGWPTGFQIPNGDPPDDDYVIEALDSPAVEDVLPPDELIPYLMSRDVRTGVNAITPPFGYPFNADRNPLPRDAILLPSEELAIQDADQLTTIIGPAAFPALRAQMPVEPIYGDVRNTLYFDLHLALEEVEP